MGSESENGSGAAEEQFIDFQCPYCATPLSFPSDNAGLAQECFNCGQVIVVPRDGAEVGRMLPIPLDTPRLCLRRFQPDDWKDVLEITADEELFRHEAGQGDEEQVIRWLQEDAKVRLTQPNQSLWLGMVLNDGGKLIGYLSVSYMDPEHRQAQVTVDVNRSYHRKGYAKEAMRAALAFCFAGIGLHRVVASCDSRNVAARRLLESAGFRLEGEFVQDRFVKGEWVNIVWYARLSAEYSSGKQGTA